MLNNPNVEVFKYAYILSHANKCYLYTTRTTKTPHKKENFLSLNPQISKPRN